VWAYLPTSIAPPEIRSIAGLSIAVRSGKERAVTDHIFHGDAGVLPACSLQCRRSIFRLINRKEPPFLGFRLPRPIPTPFLFHLANIKMLSKSLVALSLLSSSVSAETVLGVYMFHRHGDRTPKALAPANLTDLGYQQVYSSGDYYRSRYIDSDADHKILGMNTDIVKQSQISASAPSDTGEYLRGKVRLAALLTHL